MFLPGSRRRPSGVQTWSRRGRSHVLSRIDEEEAGQRTSVLRGGAQGSDPSVLGGVPARRRLQQRVQPGGAHVHRQQVPRRGEAHACEAPAP